jgi:hypothetical protein
LPVRAGAMARKAGKRIDIVQYIYFDLSHEYHHKTVIV